MPKSPRVGPHDGEITMSRKATNPSATRFKGADPNEPKPVAQKRVDTASAVDPTETVSSAPIDAADARKRMERLIMGSSESIVMALIEAAESGKVAEARYLFELSGLYPLTGETAFRPENSLAYRLLKRLGLPTDPANAEREKVSEEFPLVQSDPEGIP